MPSRYAIRRSAACGHKNAVAFNVQMMIRCCAVDGDDVGFRTDGVRRPRRVHRRSRRVKVTRSAWLRFPFWSILLGLIFMDFRNELSFGPAGGDQRVEVFFSG